MKKYYCILLFTLLAFVGSSAQSISATLNDVAGNYNVSMQTKFKVKKLGSDASTASGQLTLNSGGTFFLDEYGSSNDVSGTIYLDSKGKKIFFDLSSSGQAELKDTLTDWLESAAAAEGVYVSNTSFTFTQIKIKKVKIDKRTNRATGKAKVKVKGTVSGYANGEWVETKFTYQAKITLQ